MASYYSDEILEEIKNANDIVDVVSEYVKLKKSGRNYFGVCPFHSEKTASFSVSPEKQIFHCFGCGTGGNVIHFIIKIENLDFVEAIKFLADRARIQLPENTKEDYKPENVKIKEKFYEINIEAAKYFYNNLTSSNGIVAREYLKNRGITGETAKKYGLGFAYGINNDLSNYLISKGFNQDIIEAAGLSHKNKKDNIQDKFRARIIFPILDVRDRIIGFGGRVLDNSIPKYLNSPETLIFNKGKNLYSLNLAKKSNDKKVILVEGYMDVISLYQNGIDNVVASLGTALTPDQGRLLRKYFDEILISYDSDTAGKNATLRSLDMLNDMEIPVRVIKLEESKDPDEYIKKFGPRRFKELVSSAKSLAEFKIDLLRDQHDINDIRQKIVFVNKMAGVLSKVQNDIERDVYIKQVSGETGIAIEAIYSEIGKLIPGKMKAMRIPRNIQVVNKKINVTAKEIPVKVIQAEKMLIALLSNNDRQLFEHLKSKIDFDNLHSDMHKSIIQKIVKLYGTKKNFNHSDIIDMLENDNEISVFTEIEQKENCIDNSLIIADDLIEILEKAKWELRKKEILAELKNPDLSKEELKEIEEELKILTSKLLSI